MHKTAFAILENDKQKYIECFHPDDKSQKFAEASFEISYAAYKFVKKIERVYGKGSWEKLQQIKMYHWDVTFYVSVLDVLDVQRYVDQAYAQQCSEDKAHFYSRDFGIVETRKHDGSWYIIPQETYVVGWEIENSKELSIEINTLTERIEVPDYPLEELKKDIVSIYWGIEKSELEVKPQDE